MHNSKLFQLLRTLEHSEIRWLHKFLKSPYHNSNPQYVQLFEYIKKYYPNLEHAKLSKEVAYKNLYQASDTSEVSDAFEPQKMRKLMHELAVLVEEFLVVHHLKNNAFERQKIFISELGRRNYYKAFEKETNALLDELEQEEKRGKNHFLECYQLRKQLFGHPLTIAQIEGKDRILQLSSDIDQYYFLEKLNLACDFEANKKIYSTEITFPMMEHFLSEALKSELLDVKLYVLVYQMLRNRKDESLFKKAYRNFIESSEQLKQSSQKIFIRYLITYATNKLNAGKEEYVPYNFDLYKIGLQQKLIIEFDRISPILFSSIIASGAFLKEFEWVEQFLKDYQVFLDEAIRREVITFNEANISFQKRQFTETITLLRQPIFQNTLYKISAKILLIKTHFELYVKDDTFLEIVGAECRAFKKFIDREVQISENSKKTFTNFIKIVKKLLKSEINTQKLLREINTMEYLSNKPWLRTKVIEIGEDWERNAIYN